MTKEEQDFLDTLSKPEAEITESEQTFLDALQTSPRPLTPAIEGGLEGGLPGPTTAPTEPPLIDIGMTTPEELKKPNALLRLFGISQAMDNTERNPMFQQLGEGARQVERTGFFGRIAASQMREAQNNILAGNIAWNMLDFEERPRKALFNILALRSQKGIERAEIPGIKQYPLTRGDIKKAITDGWNGIEYMSPTDVLETQTSYDVDLWIRQQKLMDRHPSLRMADTVSKAVIDTIIAIGTEVAIGAAVTKAKKVTRPPALFSRFIPKIQATDSLDDIIMSTTERIAKSEGFSDPVEGLIKAMQADPENIDEYIRSYSTFFDIDLPGAESADEVLKGLIYKKYIQANAVDDIIPKKNVDDLILAMTNQQKKVLTELNYTELEDLALEMQSIKNAPAKYRKGFLAQINRRTSGPPVNTFARLGMSRQHDRIVDALYDKKIWHNDAMFWEIDAKRQFKKTFGKVWTEDSPIDQAMWYVANNYPVKEWDDAVRKAVTPEEIDWLKLRAAEDRDLVWNPLADMAEEQGLITTDPALIKKGVAPRLDYYVHWMNEKLIGLMKWRDRIAQAEGRGITVPGEYDLKKILRRKQVPAKFNIGEFIARKATPDDLSRNWTRSRHIAIKDELNRVLIQPEFIRFNAAVDALPVDVDTPGQSLRRNAKEALAGWARQARNMPEDIDMNLNQAFNAWSQKMEKIAPGWDSTERSWENFTRWSSKRIDQGLLLANPRPTIRNLFQSLLASNIYGHRATLWGFQQMLTPGGRRLLQTSKAYVGRGVPVAAFDLTDPRKFQRLAYLGIATTDKYINVSVSYLSGWRYYFRRKPKAFAELAEFAATKGIPEGALRRGNTFSNTLADALEAGMFSEARRTIDMRGIALTQWMYDKWAMTPLLRSSTGKLFGKYTSWQQYMWGGHMPQLWDQLRTGRDIFGMKASPAVRYAMLGFVAKGALLYQLGEQLGISMEHLVLTGSLPSGYLMGKEMPFPVSPATGAVIGGGAAAVGLAKGTMKAFGTMSIGALTEDNNLLDRGIDQLLYSGKTMIPLYGTYRQAAKAWRGEQDIGGVFWPTRKKKKIKITNPFGIEFRPYNPRHP